jgi:hypothetical protein
MGLYWPRIFSTTTYVDRENNLVIKSAIIVTIYTRFFYWPWPEKTHGCKGLISKVIEHTAR